VSEKGWRSKMYLGIREAFDLRPNYIIHIIHKAGAKIVGFQLPEGLKRRDSNWQKKLKNLQEPRFSSTEIPALGRAT